MRPIRVLSLFDGISCGRVALERAGIPVAEYMASEIDKRAMGISAANWPDIRQLGRVQDVTKETAGRVDLLIAGSPCQGFSCAGKRLNFDDPRSGLFWEFVRLLEELNPKYFLLENVVMKKEWRDRITETLGVAPVRINSALVSAQNRNRDYWTNIPFSVPTDKGVRFADIADRDAPFRPLPWFMTVPAKGDKHPRIYKSHTVDADKGPCIMANTANMHCCVRTPDATGLRNHTVREMEMMQTLPVGYVGDKVSYTAAHHAIGNGWTVDVIAHILRNMEFPDEA